MKRFLIIALALAILAAGTAQTLALTGNSSDSRNVNAAATQYIPGPQGPPGPEGDQGPQGPQGQQGQNGQNGRDGQNGQNGGQGAQGNQGQPGPAGASTSNSGNSRFTCVSSRRFVLHLYTGKYRVRQASVRLFGRDLKVSNRGSRRPFTVIDLRGRDLGVARVQIKLRLSNGRRVRVTRSFLTCGH